MKPLPKNKKPTEPLIIDCGALTTLTWPGPVSAKNVLSELKKPNSVMDEVVKRLNEYYVAEDPEAPTRCIDGRQDPNFDEKHPGPQVPGGAPGAALAYRLGVDKDDLTRGTFLSDAEAMISNYIRVGFTPGGHRDEHSAGKEAVGCGAIDGMDKILAVMTRPDLVDDHKRVVKLLLGKSFNRDDYLRVMGAAVVVNGRSRDYFKNREEIIDVLEKRFKKSITTLKGDHKECVAVVNMVKGTTMASNRFHKDFGFQAFGYDVWRSKEIAKKLLPLPAQEIDRQRYVMARVMFAVATFMALADGTQRLIIRVPADSDI